MRKCGVAIKIDNLDAALLKELAADPRTPILELAARLGIARNTVQARMKRLESARVVRGYPPTIDLQAIGFAVHAFLGVELDQNKIDDIVDALRAFPHILEVHATTGRSDLLVRIGAQTQQDLLGIIQRVHAIPGVRHTETMLALATPIEYRSLPLVEHLTNNPDSA